MQHIQNLLERQQEEKQLVINCPAFFGRTEMDGSISVIDKTVLEGAAGGTIADQ